MGSWLMDNSNIPTVSVEEIMERIRAEVRQRKGQCKKTRRRFSSSTDGDPSHYCSGNDFKKYTCNTLAAGSFEHKDEGYHVNDFFKYHDQQFVINAYRGVLRRSPDPFGFEHFLANLRTGRMTKAEILGRLRYSPEGRVCKVKLRGLLLPFVVQSTFKIPLLGYFFRIAAAIVNFPTILRNLQVLEQSTFCLFQQHNSQLTGAIEQIEKLIETLDNIKEDIETLETLRLDMESVINRKLDHEQLEDLNNRIESLQNSKADRDELAQSIAHLRALVDSKANQSEVITLRAEFQAIPDQKAENNQLQHILDQLRDIFRQIRDHRRNITDMQRRLGLLLQELRKRMPEPLGAGQIAEMVREQDHIMDAAYVSFEDVFRGTREDIQQRLTVYLPYVSAAQAGSDQAPIIDIGCGRGEWLELLKQAGWVAQGIDCNRLMIDECRNRGLDVVESDAINWLRGLAPASIGMVTGFHIIEHLPHEQLIDLLDETVRVLRPGGIAIFETPNPENILVGSYKYYIDPTHRNPLPPDMVKYLVEYRGLCQVSILRLHADAEISMVQDDNSELAKQFNKYFHGPMDYAVIGHKA